MAVHFCILSKFEDSQICSETYFRAAHSMLAWGQLQNRFDSIGMLFKVKLLTAIWSCKQQVDQSLLAAFVICR